VRLPCYVPRASKLKSKELIVSPERVVREWLHGDVPNTEVLILDIEGELFFGAAPDLEKILNDAASTARSRGTRHLVLRLKRARNPDVVASEVLEKFLREAAEKGLVVLLAGVGPELLKVLTRIGVGRHVANEFIFPEEDEEFSATLKAIRKALSLIAASDVPKTEAGAYYLV